MDIPIAQLNRFCAR